MFTAGDLGVLEVLLQRVDLKGNEAVTVANLQVKISKLKEDLLTPKQPKEEPKDATKDKK